MALYIVFSTYKIMAHNRVSSPDGRRCPQQGVHEGREGGSQYLQYILGIIPGHLLGICRSSEALTTFMTEGAWWEALS